jgi:O-antigen ligase
MKALRPAGYMNWVLPAMLALVACDILLSGRDLSQVFAELASGGGGAVRHPAMAWLQRIVSLLLVVASAERILHYFREHKQPPSFILLASYILFWIGTVAAPALLGSHPQLGHEYAYSLIIGIAAALTTSQDTGKIIDSARTALFALLLVSVLLIPVLPSMVLDASYSQGFLPGVPRLGGLAPHPVAMGMFAQTALLLLWARPFPRRWLNVLAWVLGLGVLFFAQSKTAWIAFMLCSMCMLAVRNGPGLWRRLGDPREGGFGVLFCLGLMAFALALISVVLFADVEGQLADFFGTTQGAQLMSMTGRDQIWAIAMEEWQASKLFGYGPGLWDDDFRASINMPNATSAHNQFMDTLARSGAVGAITLVIYASVLLAMSIRYAKATRGLSLALFVGLLLRAISEVPLLLFGYGLELFGHALLIVVLAAAASLRTNEVPVRVRRPAYGIAS